MRINIHAYSQQELILALFNKMLYTKGHTDLLLVKDISNQLLDNNQDLFNSIEQQIDDLLNKQVQDNNIQNVSEDNKND